MDKIIVCLCLLSLGGCASNEASREPAATPATEPAPMSHTQHNEEDTRPAAPSEKPDVAPAHEHEHPADVTGPTSENTRVNKRDRNDTTRTPGDQSEAKSDLEITKEIRQAVVGDSSLSFNAKNVKIMTEEGKVVLRGSVATGAERTTIESYARQVAGAGHVDNQIDIHN
jgi:hyperosmotically inducible protein